MKPHPRIRKTIKWGGAAVTLLLVVVWVGSGWIRCSLGSCGRFWSFVQPGRLVLGWWGRPAYRETTDAELVDDPAREAIRSSNLALSRECSRLDGALAEILVDKARPPHGLFRWFDGAHCASRGIAVVPLWLAPALIMLPTLFAWRLDSLAHRASLNLCPKCHYDRAGLAAGAKCPECGSAAP
jgi:hypothetical protein